MNRVDGNAAGGALGELFGRDFTTALVQCRSCGSVDSGAAAIVEIDHDGVIVRCRQCTRTLLTFIRRTQSHTLLTPGLASITWVVDP